WLSGRFMIAFSSVGSRPRRRLRAGSSFPTPPRKSRRKAKSSPSARALVARTAPSIRWRSRLATASCSASGR
ncbi:MAG: Heat shock protein 60 family co-chaperone GroES, partial [uncultured Sphingomonas sp.]